MSNFAHLAIFVSITSFSGVYAFANIYRCINTQSKKTIYTDQGCLKVNSESGKQIHLTENIIDPKATNKPVLDNPKDSK
ncbi:MAG: hypothetical protein P4L87_17000 [Formivibrio sp.]|nr:hypothetical protein [Formivibrio sp.]MDR3539814.1 hypothetical protein [Desulfosporosinus sp.]